MQDYIANTYTIEKLAQNLSNPNIVYFLAYNNLGDVGYIKLLLNQTNENCKAQMPRLKNICAPGFSRQGCGSAINAVCN